MFLPLDDMFYRTWNWCRLHCTLYDALIAHLDFDGLLQNLFCNLVVFFAPFKLLVKLATGFHESPVLFDLHENVFNVQVLHELDTLLKLGVSMQNGLQLNVQLCILALFRLHTLLKLINFASHNILFSPVRSSASVPSCFYGKRICQPLSHQDCTTFLGLWWTHIWIYLGWWEPDWNSFLRIG